MIRTLIAKKTRYGWSEVLPLEEASLSGRFHGLKSTKQNGKPLLYVEHAGGLKTATQHCLPANSQITR